MKRKIVGLLLIACLIGLVFITAMADEECDHVRFCGRNVCDECGEPYTGDNVYHYIDEMNWTSTETQCVGECPNCGYITEPLWHERYCTEEVCLYCGRSYTGSNVDHREYTYSYEGDYHWYNCTACGYTSPKEMHWRECNEEECWICGCSYTGSNVDHREYTFSYEGDYHWYNCTACGYTSPKEMHWRECNEEVCSYCGAPYNGDDFVMHGLVVSEGDETGCWSECQDCGYVWEKEAHWRACNEDVCSACGYSYTGSNTYHSSEVYTSDGDYHWYTCEGCGFTSPKEEHWRHCYDEVCAFCGISYTGSNVWHDEYSYLYDENGHWEACVNCGHARATLEHWRYCDEEVCLVCGAPYSGDNIEHYNIYGSDENTHWAYCSKCDYEEGFSGSHFRMCDEDICLICGAKYTRENIEHEYTYRTWLHDEDYHWFECTLCGYSSEKVRHWRWCDQTKGVCFDCGAYCSGEIVEHIYGDWYNSTHLIYCNDCNESDCYCYCDEEYCLICHSECADDQVRHYEGEWVVVQEATSEAEGLKEKRCTVCETLIEIEFIPKIDNGSSTRRPGDVTDDGVVDGRDLLRLAKYIAGYSVEIVEENATVNNDEIIDGRDLLRLAKFIGGFAVTLE